MTPQNTSNTSNTLKKPIERYSYSKLSVYEQCPFRYKLEYIDKIPQPDCDRTALIKGSKIHSILEKIEDFVYSPKGEYHDIVKNFMNSELGKDILSKPSIREHEIKLDENFLANDSLKRDETRFVGYIDRINLSKGSDAEVELIDYKTGKYKDPIYQDYAQLIYYGIYIFDKYKDIEKLKLRFVYVEHSLENTLMLERKTINIHLNKLKSKIQKIETDSVFKKCVTKLCDWCPYKDNHCNPKNSKN